jgi:hypothetical protein
MMTTRILTALAIGAALLALAPASAADTSSLSAFVHSCNTDSKGCHFVIRDAINAARNAKYGCIPETLSVEEAGNKLLEWLQAANNASPKYAKDAFTDLLWTGIDEVWPCPKP